MPPEVRSALTLAIIAIQIAIAAPALVVIMQAGPQRKKDEEAQD